MGFPLFRVTLDNDIEGPLVISEPGGWDDAKLKLDRNMEYHSLVEFYDQPLMFYGEDNANNGGLNYIRNIEQTQGIDAQVTILIEISNDEGATYEVCVEQTLEIESVKETDFYKAEFGIIRNGFWQNFINRKGTPVNLLSTTDLDGGIREAINAVTIQLPGQMMKERYYAEEGDGDYISLDGSTVTGSGYLQFLPNSIILDEIKTRFDVGIGLSEGVPVWFLEVKYAGNYDFDFRIEISKIGDASNVGGTLGQTAIIFASTSIDPFLFQLNEDTPIGFTDNGTQYYSNTDVYDCWATPPASTDDMASTLYTYSVNLDLNVGDTIRVYAPNLGEAVNEMLVWGKNGTPCLDASFFPTFLAQTGRPSGMADIPTYFSIIANTLYEDTTTPGFLIHEAGNAVTDRIIGRDGTFYSEYLGNTDTQIQSYDEDGCGSTYGLTRGLNVRGYSLADKPFFMSFDTYWNGINPLFNLGLGYETLGSPELEVIRIEPKRYFYNPTTSIDFDFVNNIERSYNPEFVFKAIEIGFEKWSAESASGVDDPQSKRVYTTRFKTVGKEIKILSKFIGASLAIEQTRRNRVEQGKDWRLDEDVMIIALNLDGSPEYQPELDENFTSITNLLNEETRYNIRLSVARNFERWKDFFNGCLQWYVGEDFNFASGEGNFDMTSTLDSSDCEGTDPTTVVDEKGDIEVTDDFLFMPVVYTFEHPMTWEHYKTIRENRNNAIGVSRTDENHISCYIMELEYQLTHRRATFTVILGEHAYL